MRAFAALLLLLAPVVVSAQEPEPPPSPEPGEIELGARLGIGIGAAGLATGGLRAAGVFLHRMSDETWFDAEGAFGFGGGEHVCHFGRDADASIVCEPGLIDGASFQLMAGIRWFPTPRASGFQPFLRGGIGVQLMAFSEDDVLGFAFPLWIGFGGRFEVADGVALGGEAVIHGGAGIWTDDLGWVATGQLVVQALVEIEI